MRKILFRNLKVRLFQLDSWTRAEPGWSLMVGALGSMIIAVSSYLYLVAIKREKFRQLSVRRRRQMHKALMLSCRQDVALAIRARMTVI